MCTHVCTHTNIYINKIIPAEITAFLGVQSMPSKQLLWCLQFYPFLGRMNGTTAVSSPLCKEVESFGELSFSPTFTPTMWQLFFCKHPNVLPEEKQNFFKQPIKRQCNKWVCVAWWKGGGKKVKGIKEHVCLFRCCFPITSRNFAKFSMSSEPFLLNSFFFCMRSILKPLLYL